MIPNYYFIVWLIILPIDTETSKEMNLSPYAFWDQNGETITGSMNGSNGSSSSELHWPVGIFISTNNTLYIGDKRNHRIVIVQLSFNEKSSIKLMQQRSTLGYSIHPHDVFVTNTSLYILDTDNYRILEGSLNDRNPFTTLSSTGLNWAYYLYVDNNANIYVSDTGGHKVVMFHSNSTNYTIVAGIEIAGSNDSQLYRPYGLFVNRNGTIYIADAENHRIMKWLPGASSGEMVSGNGTAGFSLTQLSHPTQIIVDENEYMYISERYNARITRWAPNSTFGVCIAACTGSLGTAATQLKQPHSLAFDSNGSLYVSDSGNHRVQKFQIFPYFAILHDHLKFPPCASWNLNTTTSSNINAMGSKLLYIFLYTNNAMSITPEDPIQNKVQNEQNTIEIRNLLIDFMNSQSFFVQIGGAIDNHNLKYRFDKWTLNSTLSMEIKNFIGKCTNLFIDINNSLYCSIEKEHKVIKLLFNLSTTEEEIIGGNGTNGSTSYLLNSPNGIFVDINFNLYVADSGNNRIQLFRQGNTSGETIAGNTALGAEGLNYPTGIVVDGDAYLFIADQNNDRIIRSEKNGFRCVAGCPEKNDLPSKKLNKPQALWFDNDGNMLVLDKNNSRIQKFLLTESPYVKYNRRLLIFDLVLIILNPHDWFHTGEEASYCLAPLTCWKRTRIGYNCSISTEPCDVMQPCQNQGTCYNSDDNKSYNCSCTLGFNGTDCELDQRPCKPDTCWNNSTCNDTDGIFNCTCVGEWEGDHCERKVNYCKNITCENQGVCRPLLGEYLCECLYGFSGTHCEITATKIKIYRAVAKSFSYVGIIAIIVTIMFIIIMDVLKYGFGIDPVRKERERIRQNKRIRRRKRLAAKSLKNAASSKGRLTIKKRTSLIEATL